MIAHRRAAALIVTIPMLLPGAPAAFAGTPPAPLSPTTPSWPKPTVAQLPRAGFDPRLEVMAGAVLIGVGLGLRVALRIRRA
jgi:hypothetical protein